MANSISNSQSIASFAGRSPQSREVEGILDQQQLADRARALLTEATKDLSKGDRVRANHVSALRTRAATLFSSALGPSSVYSENLKGSEKLKGTANQFSAVIGVLQAFMEDASEGFLKSLRHEVEVEVVSEFVDQAKRLAGIKKVHPAASILVVSAGAEEFLRSWCCLLGIEVPINQRSMSRFASELRTAGKLKLPEERRIQAWADYRNDAAHGDWADLDSKVASRQIREIEDFVLAHSEELA